VGVGAGSGTVTFLFTDIEGSTRLWQQDEDDMRTAVARHDELLRHVVAAHGGEVFSTMGDGLAAAFPSASSAVAAAQTAQDALAVAPWPASTPIRVRMGLHTGEAERRDQDYFGSAVNRAARLAAIGSGGQVLCSGATAGLVDAEAVLVDLGEHRLRDLDRPMRVFQVGTGSFGPLRSLDAFPGNLPRQVTSFVGREQEVAAVVEALAAAAVVTLTGVGGVGKTRLALQAAAEALPRYRDGAWLVELGPVRDGAQVIDAVTGAFSLTVAPGMTPEDALVEFLRNKQLVLIVDNCEHLISAAASMITTVIASCPGVAVLVTSREGLAVAGERVIPVPSLSAPPLDAGLDAVAASAAVRLFVDRALAVDPGFVLTGMNADAVATVCRRLDGIPLAIELAAARAPTMSPAELVARLDQRFRVLAGGRRGAVERHQTLRAAIDWSYELLTPAQQALMARMSVFAGGCTLDSAEAVCAGEPVDADDVLDLLAGLVARSLVDVGHDGPVTRYRLLETIRQYGEERLSPDEAEALRARHAEHYAQLAEAWDTQFRRTDDMEWLGRLSAENENLVSAMNWALDSGNADVGLRVGLSANAALEMGFTVAISVEPALALRGATENRLYPMALVKAAFEAAQRVDRRLAEERCAQALDAGRRLGDPTGGLLDAWACFAHALLEMTCGSFEAAADDAERAGELALAAGHPAFAAARLATSAALRVGAADEATVVDVATRALALVRQSGGSHAIMQALAALASALARTDPSRARALFAEYLETSDRFGADSAAERLQATIVAARLGDWPLTLRQARRAIPLLHWRGIIPFLLGGFNVAALALADARPDAAARLQGATRGIGRTLAAKHGPLGVPKAVAAPAGAGFVNELRREATRRLAGTLGEERLNQRRREGEDMALDDAVAYALTEIDGALADPAFS
jgi:predicted ATPase/class 3 adenylate cyclase